MTERLRAVLALCGLLLATPLYACEPQDLVIALDIGHSPQQVGAVSARGVPEYQFNQEVAELLRQRLLQAGYANTLVLSEHNPEMSLRVRASLANARSAGLLLSIHHDSVQPQYLTNWHYDGQQRPYSDRFSGYSLFFSGKSPRSLESYRFASLLGKELRRARFAPTLHHAEVIDGENRPLIDPEKGVYRYDDLIILKQAKMPAVLLECGVILNRDEEILLRNPVYRHALVGAVLEAVRLYAEDWAKADPGCDETAAAEPMDDDNGDN